MTWNPGLTQLRDVLAELYPSVEDSRSVVFDAGLTPHHIAFSSKAITNWQAILEEAHKQDKVEALVRIAVKQYSQNKALLVALETYREWVAQIKATDTEEPHSPSPTRLSAPLRKKILLLAGVSTLLVAGLIFFIVVIKSIPLRSKPLTVFSIENSRQVFGLDEGSLPLKYIENEFKDQGETVRDHTTGLMWQKSGSEEKLTYEQAQAYIENLNRRRFAGYDNWRLPTIEELISLLESEEQSNGLYINPLFDVKQTWCWSIDQHSSESAWLIGVDSGGVFWDTFDLYYYVRAVRTCGWIELFNIIIFD